jgi:GNAT superfamily N-acetyltransferase
MTQTFQIRPAQLQDERQWRALWHGYNVFYNASSISEEITHATWQRILDPQSAIKCIVAHEQEILLGFINYVIHPRTWSVEDCCYMEDLFVAEIARGKGVARALCSKLKTICSQKGLSRIYWNTSESNQVARTFYDQIAIKDDFIRYVMPLR